MNSIEAMFQKQENVIRYGLAGACVVALLVTFPLVLQEMQASKARYALAKADRTTGMERAQYLYDAKKTLTPSGPTGELYDLLAQLELLQTPVDRDASENLSKNALSRSPARAESWARLAYIEFLREGRLNQKAIDYLDRSFIVEPAGYKQFMLWRLKFMFAHWSELPHPIQETTLRSFRMLTLMRSKPFAMTMIQDARNSDLKRRASKVLLREAE